MKTGLRWKSMIMLLMNWGVTELLLLPSIESADFILTQESTCKLHLDDTNLIELVLTVIVVLSKTDFKVGGNQI